MRCPTFAFSAAIFVFGFLFSGQAHSQAAYPQIPATLSAIQDGTLREALNSYSPAYDSLPRDAQVAAYATVFHNVYRQAPAIAAPQSAYPEGLPWPSAMYQENPERYSRHWDAEKHGGTGRYEPWRDPMWSPREESGVLW